MAPNQTQLRRSAQYTRPPCLSRKYHTIHQFLVALVLKHAKQLLLAETVINGLSRKHLLSFVRHYLSFFLYLFHLPYIKIYICKKAGCPDVADMLHLFLKRSLVLFEFISDVYFDCVLELVAQYVSLLPAHGIVVSMLIYTFDALNFFRSHLSFHQHF